MTILTEVENLLTELRQAENTSRVEGMIHVDESTLPELDHAVRRMADGFTNVLRATTQVRDAQKRFFKASRTADAYDKQKLLDDSRKLEAILDKLLKFWNDEMTPSPPQTQTNLFN